MKKWTGAPWRKFIASSQKAISREKEKLKEGRKDKDGLWEQILQDGESMRCGEMQESRIIILEGFIRID